MSKVILFLSAILLFISCKKQSYSTNVNYWDVKYQVTSGDSIYSIIFRDEAGNIETINSPTIPWTYEANWSKDPGLINTRALTLAALSTGSAPIIVKIYVNSSVANQSTNGSVTYILQ
jgi:hypothetical protein